MARSGDADLRSYLESISQPALVELVLELAADDPAVSRRLALRAATHGSPDVKELKRLVGGLRHRGFLRYGRSFEFARTANEVLDALDAVAESRPAEIGPLYRTAILNLTKTSEQADDSGGVIGDALSRAMSGYAAACRAAPPDPVKLATWIADLQLDGPGWPRVPIADFAGALGEAGLDAYWQRLVQHSGPTARNLREDYLKEITHDTDALVGLYAEDLPNGFRFWQIGSVLRDAGRRDEAIAWLRRGLAEAEPADDRIEDLLAVSLSEAGKHDEAHEIRWRLFTRWPNPKRHRALLDAAERAGALTDVAGRAEAHLHERAAHGGYQADLLVDVLATSGDVDGAWAAAVRYRSSPGIMWRMAQERAATHPADVIPVYADRIEEIIGKQTKKAYTEAVRLIGELRGLHERAGSDEFPDYLAAVRQEHRKKPTFLSTLELAER